MQRAVAIGAWEQHEVQFNARLGRACELKEGDLVPKVFYGVHISMVHVGGGDNELAFSKVSKTSK